MRNILITGGAGQVGLELARRSWPDDVSVHFPGRAELDLSSRESVAAYMTSRDWAGVINCAAWTAVDAAEDHVAEADLANAKGPGWLAEAAAMAGAPMIQVSTDYVFDGSAEGYYREDDPVSPLGVYGSSKLAGEQGVLVANPRSVVLRTAWVLSVHRANFVKTMLRLAADRDELGVVADQIGCPTSAVDIASALQTIITRLMDDEKSPTGVYHFVNAGEASWCDLARTAFELSEQRGGPHARVKAISTADYPTKARRPANSRLATAKITRDFGITPRPWRDAVAEIIDELVPAGQTTGKAA